LKKQSANTDTGNAVADDWTGKVWVGALANIIVDSCSTNKRPAIGPSAVKDSI